jgi:hypothetical protein
MATLHLTVSEDVRARLLRLAREAGYASVEEYAEHLLHESAEEQVIDDELEALLVERLDDPRPGIELTSEFKQAFRDEMQRRRRRGGT